MYNEELWSDTLGFNWEGGNTLFLMIGTQSNKQLIQHFIIMNYITNSGMDIGQLPCTRNCNCTILCSKGKPCAGKSSRGDFPASNVLYHLGLKVIKCVSFSTIIDHHKADQKKFSANSQNNQNP